MSFLFNPFTANFDAVTDLSVTAVGSTPNANGATVTQVGATASLTLQLADATHPGLVLNVGAANGVATLDSAGHVPLSQLPPTLIEYQGTWNAATNTPTLSNASGSFNVSGYFFIVSTGGTVNFGAGNITFNSGDWVLYNGTIWERAVQSNIVQSVNGQTGVVTVNAINQLTGDATAGPASGSASAALTLATVNSNVGTFASVTVNAKGLVTAASALSGDATTSGAALTLATVNTNVGAFGSASSVATFTVNAKGLTTAAGNTPIQITESQVTNLTTDLASKQAGPLTGDVTTTGAAATLATVNSNVGSFTNANVTVNAKGLVTAASSGTGSSSFNVTSKTSAYTAVPNDLVLVSGAAFTVTLPTAVGISGQSIRVKKTDAAFANIITLATTSSQTIDGVTTTTLNTQYEDLWVTSDGANWQVISRTYQQQFATYTSTIVGLGTTTSMTAQWRRLGDSVQIQVNGVAGTPTAVALSVSIPSGLTTDNTGKINPNGYMLCGEMLNSTSGGILKPIVTFNQTTFGYTYNAVPTSPQLANSQFVLSSQFSFNVIIPINGWNG